MGNLCTLNNPVYCTDWVVLWTSQQAFEREGEGGSKAHVKAMGTTCSLSDPLTNGRHSFHSENKEGQG